MNLRWNPPRITAAAILGASFLFCVAVNAPGHLSYDSILQLLQGRLGLYNSWHPPVMAWLLGLGDAVVPGPGLFAVFEAALAFGALAGVLAVAGRAGWTAVAVLALAAVSPQLLIYQGVVWKDVLFADAMAAGFVALALAAASRGWPRWGAAGMSLVLLTLAGLARQNGIVVLPFAAAAVGWIAAREGRTRWRAAAVGAGALAALLLCVAGGNALLALRSDGEPAAVEQFRLLQIYDLAGAIAREPGFPLAAMDDDDPQMADALHANAARLYTPMRNDPLMSAPAMHGPLGTLDEDALNADWRTLVTQHPWLYLKIRAADFGWVAFTPDIVACRPIFTGIEGPAAELKALGITPRRDGRDLALERYGKAFMWTPVLSHIPFALIALGGIVVLLRRRRGADIAMAAMLGGALTFGASFLPIAISCDYRYLYALDLAAIAAALYLACDRRMLWHQNSD
jgi:hypothetical protein